MKDMLLVLAWAIVLPCALWLFVAMMRLLGLA